MTSGKAPRPKTDAQMGFDLLMELYEKGQTLDTKSQVELVNKFLAVREPGRQVPRWGFFLKANRAERIVNALREGLDDLRDRKPFIRPALAIDITNVETFQDGIVWDQLHGRVARTGSRDPRHLFFTRVFELLTEVAPWLRVCQREGCRRLFLFQRPKQIYCSDSCAQRVRMARFLKQREPTLSANRQSRRDYAQRRAHKK